MDRDSASKTQKYYGLTGGPFFRVDSDGLSAAPIPLAGLWMGCACFLIASGPSLRATDLSQLHKPGILTLGINNSPALHHPNFWVYIDRWSKFHDGIWRDPSILKFAPWHPASHFRKPLRQKVGNRFCDLSPPRQTVCQMPSVIGMAMHSSFDPETWLSHPTISRGNDQYASTQNGHPHCLNVMFAAMKVAYVLGIRSLYLVGCDFRMDDPEQPYAFSERKTMDGYQGVAKCRKSYENMNAMFALLRPRFDAANFRVVNCTPGSRLDAFERMPFLAAVGEAKDLAAIPSSPWDTEGWYKID